MNFRLAGLLALAGAWVVAHGAGPISEEALATAAQLRERALKGTQAYALVESLTTEVGPRMAGSPADKAGVDWAVAKLKELKFDKVWTEPVSFPYWVRGEETARVVSPFPQPLWVTALGYSVGTPANGIEADIVEIPTYEMLLETEAAKVKGKIVYISNRMQRHHTGRGYGPAVVARTRGASAAAKLGAAALLIRSIGTDNNRMPHTGVMRYEDGVKQIPAAALSNPDADLLSAMVRRGKPVRVHLQLGCRMQGTASSANVIGEIHGREKTEEVVLLGAHLDSWDKGTGAVDDGAGVAIVIEAAHLIAGLESRPRRTIRVVLFSNEEQGIFGGRAYAQKYGATLAQHALASESDFGAGRIWGFRAQVLETALPAIEQIAAALEPLGIVKQPEPGAGGADLGPMRRLGMPAVSLLQDGSDYFDWHHTDNDTLDKIDPKALNQNVAAYAVFGYLAAEAPVAFGPLPPPE